MAALKPLLLSTMVRPWRQPLHGNQWCRHVTTGAGIHRPQRKRMRFAGRYAAAGATNSSYDRNTYYRLLFPVGNG